MSGKNLLRQIQDIQIQADRLINETPDFHEFEDFNKFSQDLQSYILSNYEDDFIQEHVSQIPVLDSNTINAKASLESGIAFFLNGIMGYFLREKRRIDRAKEITREIKGKFGSLEFLIKNHF